MNALVPNLLWSAVPVTLFTSAGMLLYFAVRRLGPAAGSLVASALLLTTIGVSALTLSPWPHWFAWAPAAGAPAEETAVAMGAAPQPLAPGADSSDAADALPAKSASADSLSGIELAGDAWHEFWQDLKTGRSANAAPEEVPYWPSLLGVVFIAGLGAAFLKLALGLYAVRLLRADSTAIEDAELQRVVDEVCRRLDCRRTVEVRQSRRLTSPATIGWRRPLVLLPACWRTWRAEERRVVLAHEIAHVGRGDYRAGVVAQFSLALHFYHPLVHWLARRLRLEQELAADALGAEAAGGREAYLTTLAQMALKQDDRAIAWAARPFLPSRGAFLRRIEMLRNPRQFRPAAISRGRQFVIVATVGVIGLLSAGLRGPQGESIAQQPAKQTAAPAIAASDADAPEAQAKVDWSYVPPNVAAVGIVRPAALLSRNEMQPLAELIDLIDEEIGLREALGLSIRDLAEVQYAMPRFPTPKATDALAPILVLRAKQPHDWKEFADSLRGDHMAANFLGRTYYKASDSRNAFSYYSPDDRTIVLASEPQLQRVLALSKTSPAGPEWAADWPAGEAAAMIDLALFNSTVGPVLKQAPPTLAAVNSFSPLWEKTERSFFSVKLSQGLRLEALAQCGSEERAEEVNRTLEAALTLARNSLNRIADQLVASPNLQEAAGAMLALSDLGVALIKQAEVKVADSEVRLQCQVAVDVADTAVALLTPAVIAARSAARRSQSMNNLKYLIAAMQKYAEVHKHFPAAVIIGPDGKTSHSWRVELLPYLGEEPLYKQYKMDEPWDSENNKRVLEQMPSVFRHPAADPNDKDASYFAVTGEPTIFPGEKASRFAEIRDGTSNTIALVEAQRPIPWTKPEDIPYDPAKPLPKLGGYEPETFNAAFADGSVRSISQGIDAALLRAWFTRAGQEVVELPPPAN